MRKLLLAALVVVALAAVGSAAKRLPKEVASPKAWNAFMVQLPARLASAEAQLAKLEARLAKLEKRK